MARRLSRIRGGGGGIRGRCGGSSGRGWGGFISGGLGGLGGGFAGRRGLDRDEAIIEEGNEAKEDGEEDCCVGVFVLVVCHVPDGHAHLNPDKDGEDDGEDGGGGGKIENHGDGIVVVHSDRVLRVNKRNDCLILDCGGKGS